MRKYKNKILKLVTAVAAVLFVVSANFLDITSIIPFIICVVCLLWLGLFAYANNFFDGLY